MPCVHMHPQSHLLLLLQWLWSLVLTEVYPQEAQAFDFLGGCPEHARSDPNGCQNFWIRAIILADEVTQTCSTPQHGKYQLRHHENRAVGNFPSIVSMTLRSCSLSDVFNFFNGDWYSAGAPSLSSDAFTRAASCCSVIEGREASLVGTGEVTEVVGGSDVAVASLLPIASFSRFLGGGIAFGLSARTVPAGGQN